MRIEPPALPRPEEVLLLPPLLSLLPHAATPIAVSAVNAPTATTLPMLLIRTPPFACAEHMCAHTAAEPYTHKRLYMYGGVQTKDGASRSYDRPARARVPRP